MCICEHPLSLYTGYNFQGWFLACVGWELILHGNCLFPAASISTAGCCFVHPYFPITYYSFNRLLLHPQREKLFSHSKSKAVGKCHWMCAVFFSDWRKLTPLLLWLHWPKCMGLRFLKLGAFHFCLTNNIKIKYFITLDNIAVLLRQFKK